MMVMSDRNDRKSMQLQFIDTRHLFTTYAVYFGFAVAISS